jgi:hypothetical protein
MAIGQIKMETFQFLTIIITIIIKFNFHLFTCKLINSKANFKASTSKGKETKLTNKIRNKAIYIFRIIIIIPFIQIKGIIKQREKSNKIYIYNVFIVNIYIFYLLIF